MTEKQFLKALENMPALSAERPASGGGRVVWLDLIGPVVVELAKMHLDAKFDPEPVELPHLKVWEHAFGIGPVGLSVQQREEIARRCNLWPELRAYAARNLLKGLLAILDGTGGAQ